MGLDGLRYDFLRIRRGYIDMYVHVEGWREMAVGWIDR